MPDVSPSLWTPSNMLVTTHNRKSHTKDCVIASVSPHKRVYDTNPNIHKDQREAAPSLCSSEAPTSQFFGSWLKRFVLAASWQRMFPRAVCSTHMHAHTHTCKQQAAESQLAVNQTLRKNLWLMIQRLSEPLTGSNERSKLLKTLKTRVCLLYAYWPQVP